MEEYSKTRNCLYCGKEFEGSTRHHKYCSSRCKEAYRLAHLEIHEGICKGCGKPITYKLKAGKPTRQYCCASCQVKHTVPTRVLRCVDCGKEFRFTGRTRKLRCEKCWKKHRSVTNMAARALKNPSIQLGVGSGGGQNKDLDLPDSVRKAMNATKRKYYAENAERMRAIARSKYRERALAETGICAICGYSDNKDALVVHHKDMDRANGESSNLAVLCANCHMILHKEIKRRQKIENISATEIYNQMCGAELKERNEAGKPDMATRTEGSEESESGATHSDTSSSDMSHHEAAPETDDNAI